MRTRVVEPRPRRRKTQAPRRAVAEHEYFTAPISAQIDVKAGEIEIRRLIRASTARARALRRYRSVQLTLYSLLKKSAITNAASELPDAAGPAFQVQSDYNT
jgi:hypothetical protein